MASQSALKNFIAPTISTIRKVAEVEHKPLKEGNVLYVPAVALNVLMSFAAHKDTPKDIAEMIQRALQVAVDIAAMSDREVQDVELNILISHNIREKSPFLLNGEDDEDDEEKQHSTLTFVLPNESFEDFVERTKTAIMNDAELQNKQKALDVFAVTGKDLFDDAQKHYRENNVTLEQCIAEAKHACGGQFTAPTFSEHFMNASEEHKARMGRALRSLPLELIYNGFANAARLGQLDHVLWARPITDEEYEAMLQSRR